jgi:two-component system, sensor histidine kinase and response regulator
MRARGTRIAPAPHPVIRGDPVSAASTKLLRLLLVEDSEPCRALFGCLIEDVSGCVDAGIECDLARSGPEALDRLHQKRYDALILDQNMPGMSGLEVLAALRGLRRGDPPPKVLAYSSCDAPDFRRQCLAAGADAFASKYMDMAEFIAVLRQLGLVDGARA